VHRQSPDEWNGLHLHCDGNEHWRHILGLGVFNLGYSGRKRWRWRKWRWRKWRWGSKWWILEW